MTTVMTVAAMTMTQARVVRVGSSVTSSADDALQVIHVGVQTDGDALLSIGAELEKHRLL
jgi:hypothetical protein